MNTPVNPTSMSKYARKVRLNLLPKRQYRRPLRVCFGCGLKLPKKKGHGWVSRDGKGIYCSSCIKPPGRGN